MFNNIKNRFISVIAPDVPMLPGSERDMQRIVGTGGRGRQQQMQDKFQYARPPFLQLLTADELRASADHNVRPIIVPRDINLLPWGAGYAECVNSGKSEWNEDQAAFCRQVLSDPEHKHPDLPYTYFGIFDGHAGYGAALAASHQFHHILHEKLVDCIELLLPLDLSIAAESNSKVNNSFPHPMHFLRRVSKDELIVGALESAFFHMDELIARDDDRYRDAGGCTACVALFINGKMYVANAGDSRAVLCQRKAQIARTLLGINDIEEDIGAIGAYPIAFSADHTPETERDRLLNVARLRPYLMGKHYVAMEYAKRPHIKDMGQRILCRQGTMKGWTYKTLTREDLRIPVVTGEGKRSRLLGTLGVTRGFGDHELLAINTGTQIKPFLTPHPDVKQRDLTQVVSISDENNEDGDYGVLVMATDGLWDVSENEAVSRTVFQTLSKYPTERHRYTMVAQELVARARGKINDSGHWRLADSKAAATVDDISVIVIPVSQYYKEHMEWVQKCTREQKERNNEMRATEATEENSRIVNGLAEMAHVVEENEQEHRIDVLPPGSATIINSGDAAAAANKTDDVDNNDDVIDDDDDDNDDDDEEEEDIVVELNTQLQNVLAQDTIDAALKEATQTLEAVKIDGKQQKQKEDVPKSSAPKSKKAKQQQQQQNQRNRNAKQQQ